MGFSGQRLRKIPSMDFLDDDLSCRNRARDFVGHRWVLKKIKKWLVRVGRFVSMECKAEEAAFRLPLSFCKYFD